MNINDLVLFTETAVDRLFDIFKEDFQLQSEYRSKDVFVKHIKEILKKHNININFIKTSKQNTVSGTYYASDSSITIFVPVRRVSLQELMNAIFHEFAHYIVEDRVSNKLNPIDKENVYDYTFPIEVELKNPYKIFGLFLEKNAHVLMDQMLEYWTQPHERSNIAFSIAYDIYDENKPFKANLIDVLVTSHLECWNEYHSKKDLEYFDKYIKKFQKVGSLTLFSIIFYRQELLSKKELSRKLALNVPRLIELVEKYYRRIGGILHNTKNSQTYLQF